MRVKRTEMNALLCAWQEVKRFSNFHRFLLWRFFRILTLASICISFYVDPQLFTSPSASVQVGGLDPCVFCTAIISGGPSIYQTIDQLEWSGSYAAKPINNNKGREEKAPTTTDDSQSGVMLYTCSVGYGSPTEHISYISTNTYQQ